MAQVYDVDIEKLIHRCNKRLTKMTQDMYRSYKSINLFKTYLLSQNGYYFLNDP